MTREELDILWQKALHESVKNGEQFSRYHFAALVAEHERKEVAQMVLNDAWALTFQTFSQYRSALAKSIRARGQECS